MNSYVVQTYDLSKNYGDYSALRQVSIRLKAGHIYGLIGQNGAGKTTMMTLLAGL